MLNQDWIKNVFYQLISVRSDSNTVYETIIEDALINIMSQHPYFQEKTDCYGLYPLADDQLSRGVVWCFVRGKGNKTVVLVNHHDAVDTVEYGSIKDIAFRPDDLKAALKEKSKNKVVLKDAEDDKWIFGRGTADMKGGLASQLGLVDMFTRREAFDGNILFISVPDEETISKGMLSAVNLLGELKEKHSFEYVLMVNSEPYFNQTKGKAIMYEGSVGKIMPVVYVKGVKSHISDPFAGINPSLILSEIQKRTELNASLCDVQGLDASPPPVWINLKDRKKAYDASIPEAAVGYFNWLTFSRTPSDVLKNMIMLSKHSMTDVLVRHQQAYDTFCMLNHEESETLEYTPVVLTFSQLYQQALEKGKAKFEKAYRAHLASLKGDFQESKIALPESALKLIEFVADYVELEGPAVVLGLSGPYYPHISNAIIKNGTRYDLLSRVNEISLRRFDLAYQSNSYFMGMSDLSYAGFVGNRQDIRTICENSPGWDEIYTIPFDELNKLSMPVVNIGPWGKDLHKTTERVFAPDVFERIPMILYDLIESILNEQVQEKNEKLNN